MTNQNDRSEHGLVWFRRDLRLEDNPAWSAASSTHRLVTALYVLDPRLLATAASLRRRQHLADLHALDGTLQEHGGRLLVRHGDPTSVVPAEVARTGVDGIYWNADVTPYATRRDQAVTSALDPSVTVETHWGNLVLPPGSVHTNAGKVSRVFGPFHKRWKATSWDPWPEPGNGRPAKDPGDGLPPLDGAPPVPAGEDGAHETLARFLDGPADDYRRGHNDVPHDRTSGLSVALRFGTISPRQVVRAVDDGTEDRLAFVRQLAWRDWYAHLLAEMPTMPVAAVRPEYDTVAWRDDPDGLLAWQEGRTGYPLVDAGMRQLAATGTMHNRVRMVVASFLVKDLLIDWRAGERHFRRLLLDADVAQNAGNWQWVAGTGPDAAPYFRVFNPITQSRTHDPDGSYVRRWVPELSGLDRKAIHAPWETGPLELVAAGVTLGTTYPYPIVDHGSARHRAIAAYEQARTQARDQATEES
ncbi:MAG: deoxyribodipyrimidine photo-lyase [Aquihabitans sp.]